jgi:K+-transporting ATPase KdpF subunit
MTLFYWIAGALALALFAYLLMALFRAEEMS